jgi:glutamate synthase (NADPH/NADH) large chain
MQMVLDGQANDFVGKGLSGGEIVIRPRGLAAKESGQHVILGNVALYGATCGRLFAAGRAGERFAVRNSGAVSIVEGVGDHGCEYMTGGTVVVLGETGLNFGAGMTGGIAWVYDAKDNFVSKGKFHPEFVEPQPFATLEAEAQEGLRSLIEEHVTLTDSGLAKALLGDWASASQKFVRLMPKPQV